MYYEDRTDDYIINFITRVRKMSLKKDLRRHKWALLKKNIGFYVTNQPKEQLEEWIGRLNKIIKKQEPNMNKKLLFVVGIDAMLFLIDIFIIRKIL